MEIRDTIEKINLMISFPQIVVRMSGGPVCKKTFQYFTKPHAKYKIIQNKKWGVAMLELPDTFDQYLSGQSKQMLRRKRKRAQSNGYTFKKFFPLDHLTEMMDINTSMNTRQGEPMNPIYLSEEKVREYFKDIQQIDGVFDQNGTLCAYLHAPVCGEMFLLSRLLGHAEHLSNGIMYFLISEVVREKIEEKNTNGIPIWAMYDTFIGASDGLRYFKERLGFKPYRVKWKWDNT